MSIPAASSPAWQAATVEESLHRTTQPTFALLAAALLNHRGHSSLWFVILSNFVTSLLRHRTLLSANVSKIQLSWQTPVFGHQLNSPHRDQKPCKDASLGEEAQSSGQGGSAAGQAQAPVMLVVTSSSSEDSSWLNFSSFFFSSTCPFRIADFILSNCFASCSGSTAKSRRKIKQQ